MITKRAEFWAWYRKWALLGPIIALLWGQIGWAADPPFQLPPAKELAKLRSAVITTEKGDMVFELYPEEAPWHVANFKYLADKGWYKNSKFHRFYSGYLIQGGAPPGQPEGGPGYTIPPEFGRRKHELGTLGMARAPNYLNPERRSNGSQFHILMTEAHNMDGAYTIFGQLKAGKEVLESLQKDDPILDVRVYVRTR